MRDLLLATSNLHKLEEYQALFSDLPYRLLSLEDIALQLEVEETGTTYAENALLKARTFTAAAGMLTLADDSGLEIDALGGAPGVLSARFGGIVGRTLSKGPTAVAPTVEFVRAGGEDTQVNGASLSYEERFRIILDALRGKDEEQRGARFRCTIAIAEPTGYARLVEGSIEGQIAMRPLGQHGFGYDPIFLVPELGKTLAELAPGAKSRISHRGRAAHMAQVLLEIWPPSLPSQ